MPKVDLSHRSFLIYTAVFHEELYQRLWPYQDILHQCGYHHRAISPLCEQIQGAA